MLLQLSINCCIRHCRVCCLVPWAATQSSRAHAARLDWLQLRLMCSTVLMRLQELSKTCASLVGRSVTLLFFLFWRKVAKFLHDSCAWVLFYFILFQCKWANCFSRLIMSKQQLSSVQGSVTSEFASCRKETKYSPLDARVFFNRSLLKPCESSASRHSIVLWKCWWSNLSDSQHSGEDKETFFLFQRLPAVIQLSMLSFATVFMVMTTWTDDHHPFLCFIRLLAPSGRYLIDGLMTKMITRNAAIASARTTAVYAEGGRNSLCKCVSMSQK